MDGSQALNSVNWAIRADRVVQNKSVRTFKKQLRIKNGEKETLFERKKQRNLSLFEIFISSVH